MKKLLFLLFVGITLFSVNNVSAQSGSEAFLPLYLVNNSSNDLVCLKVSITDMDGIEMNSYNGQTYACWINCAFSTTYIALYELNVGSIYVMTVNYGFDGFTPIRTQRVFQHKTNQKIDFLVNSSKNLSIELKPEIFR